MNDKKYLYLAWIIALFATITSLVFSELLKFPPCSLCWYQRVFMYSLAFVIPTGVLINDRNACKYILVLSIAGLVISGYHSLLYHDIIPESTIHVCTAELSCKAKQFELFGFLSIPVMSFLGFLAIVGLSFKGNADAKRN